MSSDTRGELFRFGPFELDVDREALKRSGLLLRLPRQPLRLLILLARRAGETITRDEIRQELWGTETHVDYEQGINTAIRHIRYHLGDKAEAPRYVRTVPRQGYVFIAPIEQSGGQALLPVQTVSPRRPRFSIGKRLVAAALAALMAVVLAAAIATSRPRALHRCLIAIRPFEIIGSAPDGVDPRVFTEEMRATLSTLPQRHVTLAEGNRAGKADVVIVGTIQHVSDDIRVIVSGSGTASRTRLWSTTVSRPASRASDAAIEIAHRTLREVAGRYLPAPRHEPVLRSEVTPRVLDLYRRGRRDRAQAKSLYEQAVQEEPQFAEAWSGLADLWAGRMLAGPDRATAAARTREYALRALALQPRNAEAHSALAIVALQYDYDLGAAEARLRRAVAADPDYPDAHFNLGLALTTRGRFDEALRELEAARQLDPVAFDLHPSVPMLYLHARRYEDAIAAYHDILAVQPAARTPRWGLLSAHVAQRQWSDAIDQIWILAELPPEERSRVPATVDGFRAVYRRNEPRLLYAGGRVPPHDFERALYYAELGDRDRALAMLQRAIDTHTPSVSYLLVDPRLDALRADPRFNTLVARTNFRRGRE